MKILTIGIPTYNEVRYIEKTIENIFDISRTINYQIEILIIDNNSLDGTIEYLKKISTKSQNVSVRVIFNSENKGFNYSYDYLAKNAKGNYIWIIGAQDIIYSKGLQMLEQLWELDFDYLICNAKIRDEKTNSIINESLWGNLGEQTFSTIENFFEALGGPCQALSCNIIRTEFIKPHLDKELTSPLWGFIERLMDSLNYNREHLKIKFINIALVEMLIETEGWQTTIPLGSWSPVIEISEVYKLKLKDDKQILSRAAPFRDVFSIPRTFVEGRANGLDLNFGLLARLRAIYGHSLSFWFVALPLLFLPKFVARILVRTKVFVHLLRRVFRLKTF